MINKKLSLLLVGYFLFTAAFAQTGEFPSEDTRRGLSRRFNLPISFGFDGSVNIFESSDGLALNPVFSFGDKKKRRHYLKPIVVDEFRLTPPVRGAEWMQYDLIRKERGLGIRVGDGVKVGLMLFKGSQTVARRSQATLDEVLDAPALPKNMNEVQLWNDGDVVQFQTYGGLKIFAGLGLGGELGAISGFTIQNSFVLRFKKLNKDQVALEIEEENTKIRRIDLDWGPVAVSTAKLNGKLLKMELTLDFSNGMHQEIYERVLNGRIDQIQKAYPEIVKHISWSGRENELQIGFSPLAGEIRTKTLYSYNEGTEEVYVESKKAGGFFAKKRDHRDYVFADEFGIILFWTSKIDDADYKSLDKHFFKRSRTLRLRSFSNRSPAGIKYGDVNGEMGIALTKEELVSFVESKSGARRVGKELARRLRGDWNKNKIQLGKMLLKSPSLIRSMVETQKKPTPIHFSFTSDGFQSITGSTVVTP